MTHLAKLVQDDAKNKVLIVNNIAKQRRYYKKTGLSEIDFRIVTIKY